MDRLTQCDDGETVQDYSKRCDILFSRYILFASRVRVDSAIRKGEDVFITLSSL